MVPFHHARVIVAHWNELHPNQFVPWETAAECLTAFERWQSASATQQPAHKTTEHLIRHNEFARRIPDNLMLLLVDEDDESNN